MEWVQPKVRCHTKHAVVKVNVQEHYCKVEKIENILLQSHPSSPLKTRRLQNILNILLL